MRSSSILGLIESWRSWRWKVDGTPSLFVSETVLMVLLGFSLECTGQ